MRRRGRLSVGFVLTVVAVVAFAPAAGARRWTRIASGGMNVSDQVGLARSSDGVLHVAWRRQGSTQELSQTPIVASGRVGSPVTIVSGWASVGSPALVGQGRVLSAFFPGTATLTTGDPTYGLDLARSDNAGASWRLSPTAIARNQFAFASTPAAVGVSGSFVQAWSGPDSTVVHTGLDPNVPPLGGYGSGTDQALAAAADGQVMVAWCNELAAGPSVFLAHVDPATGARIGDVVPLEASGGCPADTRVALASFRDIVRNGRNGQPLFYVAASDEFGHVYVYVTTPQGHLVLIEAEPFGSVKQQIAISATPHGRIWVGWKDSATGDLVFRRSDPRDGYYGAAVTVHLPPGQTISQLALNAQDDRLDAIATTSDDNNTVSLFATQVLPGLTLEPETAKRTERFRVLDAGIPVRDATVKVARRTLTTDSSGYAMTRLPPGSYTAAASKRGYVNASVQIRIP